MGTSLDRKIKKIKKNPKVTNQKDGIKEFYRHVHIYNKKESNNCYEIDSRLLDKRYVQLKKKRDGVKIFYWHDWCLRLASIIMFFVYPEILKSENSLSFIWVYLFVILEVIKIMQDEKKYYGLMDSDLIDCELSEIKSLFDGKQDILVKMNMIRYWALELKYIIIDKMQEDRTEFIVKVLVAISLLIGIIYKIVSFLPA